MQILYLSRVEIDVMNRKKTKDLTHLGAYHNWVESCFPIEMANGERKRHLWRIDILNGKQYLLVLSEEKPDKKAFAKYGVDNTVMVKSYDGFLSKLNVGQIMLFKLTANPTHCNGDKVYPHITIEQQNKWLSDRANKLGFEFLESKNGMPTFDIVSREWKILKRRGSQNVRLSVVTYQGILKINDLDLFKKMLLNGIGREKAFGMGLMTVIPKG